MVRLMGWPRRAIYVQTNRVLTKNEMVMRAAQAGFGTPRRLRLRFEKYQKHGLLGRMAGKEGRQGGSGLWHPAQAALWIFYLNNRGRARLATLANMPVFLWFMGVEGVDSEQSHHAFCFWASEFGAEGPTGPRSLRRRVIDARVANISSPTASASAKRRLRELYEQINDAFPDLHVDRELFVEAFVSAIGPDIESMQARRLAEVEFGFVRSACEAIRRRDQLCQPQPAVTRLWEWARDWLRGTLDSESDRPVVPPDQLTPEILKAAASHVGPLCWLLLVTLGGAVADPDLLPAELRPPHLPFA
jgi:hypothetical protein